MIREREDFVYEKARSHRTWEWIENPILLIILLGVILWYFWGEKD